MRSVRRCRARGLPLLDLIGEPLESCGQAKKPLPYFWVSRFGSERPQHCRSLQVSPRSRVFLEHCSNTKYFPPPPQHAERSLVPSLLNELVTVARLPKTSLFREPLWLTTVEQGASACARKRTRWQDTLLHDQCAGRGEFNRRSPRPFVASLAFSTAKSAVRAPGYRPRLSDVDLSLVQIAFHVGSR